MTDYTIEKVSEKEGGIYYLVDEDSKKAIIASRSFSNLMNEYSRCFRSGEDVLTKGLSDDEKGIVRIITRLLKELKGPDGTVITEFF